MSIQYTRQKVIIWFCVLGAVFFSASPRFSQALEYGYTLEYHATQSDNVELSEINPQRERISTSRATLFLRETASPNVRANILAGVAKDNYADNILADRTRLNLGANVNWTIVPEGFSWIIEDYYGQTFQDVLRPGTSDNLRDVNVFSTGPDINFRINPVNRLFTGFRVGNYYVEQTNIDSNRYFGFGGWRYKASSTTDVSLNYTLMRRIFKDTSINGDYDLENIFFRLESKRTQRSTVAVDLGVSHFESDAGASLDAPLASMLFTYAMPRGADLKITANTQFTDATNAILAAGSVNAVTAPIGNTDSSRIYRLKEVDGSYTQPRSYGTDRVRLFAQRLDYEAVFLDQDRAGASVDVGLGFTSTLSGALFTSYISTNYIDQAFIDKDGIVGLRFQYQMRPQVFLGLEGRRTNRVSNLSTRDYDEDRAIVSIAYRSIPFRVD